MRPDPRFTGLSKEFWANVRTISEAVGYTVRGKGIIRVPSMAEVIVAFSRLGLSWQHIRDNEETLTDCGSRLFDYFEYRAEVLNNYVEPRLMNADEARALFEELHAKLKPSCPLPMNKQKKEKRAPAYLTCIVNMLIEKYMAGLGCDWDPRSLTTITRDSVLVRTLARRVDGAFPSVVNPVALWEIKEYYYTTTFGSRVADGVYESLLDGMELEELREQEGIDVKHYVMADAHYTFWDCGRSYLCRMVDMLHMGYVDEFLFGREVAERLPGLVAEWVELVKARKRT